MQIYWIYKDAILDAILDGRSVLDKLFFQNEVQRASVKLVLVTYPLDLSRSIYSPSNFNKNKMSHITI